MENINFIKWPRNQQQINISGSWELVFDLPPSDSWGRWLPCLLGRPSSGSAAFVLCGADRSSDPRSRCDSAARSPDSERNPPSASVCSPSSHPDTHHWPHDLGHTQKHTCCMKHETHKIIWKTHTSSWAAATAQGNSEVWGCYKWSFPTLTLMNIKWICRRIYFPFSFLHSSKVWNDPLPRTLSPTELWLTTFMSAVIL